MNAVDRRTTYGTLQGGAEEQLGLDEQAAKLAALIDGAGAPLAAAEKAASERQARHRAQPKCAERPVGCLLTLSARCPPADACDGAGCNNNRL